MLEKEKLLLQAISPLTTMFFKRLLSQTRQKVSLCGNGLRMIENIIGKGEIDGTSISYFFFFSGASKFVIERQSWFAFGNRISKSHALTPLSHKDRHPIGGKTCLCRATARLVIVMA